MGRVGSSSRRKHSKKKTPKVSPEARRKKISRRKKSKKLRRHDDSFSSFSEDESTSSSSLSSSSSDGEYKSKRSRSRARNEEKGGKKRTRSRSLSEDSSPVKKRKGSKNSDSRKKNKKIKKKKKKKPKRDAYISSASCSTCKDGDSSSDEEGSRGRSREKKRNHRDSNKGRDEYRENRSRTRSSSPSKLNNSYDDEHIEEVAVENNSRRLKSVITVAKPPENELKEEIVYDYDDYPSCKSNDSNELVDRSNISPEKKIPTSMIGEVNSASSPNEKESNASGNVGSEVGNLESILRQKALENLSKFRGGLKTKPVALVVDKHKSDQSVVKQPASASVSMTPVSQPVAHRSRFTWRRDLSVTTLKDEKAVTYSGPESSGLQPAAAPKLQSAENKIVNETLKSVANNNNTSGGTGTNVDQKSTTALETPASTKEGSSKGQQTENNDNSQFEKKTMSVMRGGEMVQVSYKVYIPNRAPALARRQLKR